jgi:hypothetical protein
VLYLLGENPSLKSFLIGKTNSIQNPRHKGSSCNSPPQICLESAQNEPSPNPNPVFGGIIKAVFLNDIIDDSRISLLNEIRLIDNAPMIGILVRMFKQFGDPLNKDQTLFPKNTCPDLPGDYSGFYTSNLKLYESYLAGKVPSPFPIDGRIVFIELIF